MHEEGESYTGSSLQASCLWSPPQPLPDNQHRKIKIASALQGRGEEEHAIQGALMEFRAVTSVLFQDLWPPCVYSISLCPTVAETCRFWGSFIQSTKEVILLKI